MGNLSFIWQAAVHFSVLPGGWTGARFSAVDQQVEGNVSIDEQYWQW